MALRFLSLVRILNNGRRSDFPRCNPRAMSLAEAGSVLTCRKRNRFSGLRLEVRGIRWLDAGYRLQATGTILLKFFCRGAKLFLGGWGFIGRPTHDWLVTLRQTSWFSPRGECEEAGRPGPPLLFFVRFLSRFLGIKDGPRCFHVTRPTLQKPDVGPPSASLQFLLDMTCGRI